MTTGSVPFDLRRRAARVGVLAVLTACGGEGSGRPPAAEVATEEMPITAEPAKDNSSSETLAEGQRIFRHETFGDEKFWTDTARMHEVIQKSVSPKMALSVGLKVDASVIPPDVAQAIKDGKVDLDLDVGAIIALSPATPPEQKTIYKSWGPGKYDPRMNQDQKNTPLVIPPAYGLAKVTNETYTAEGPISYWNAYVAVTQMHGQGNFSDPRLGIDVKHPTDMVTPKLAALRNYQH